MDLRIIKDTSYQPEKRIIGDLEYYGWVVVRSVKINEADHAAIDDISRRGSGKLGTRYGIEDHPNYKLKYNINSKISKEWGTGYLGDLVRDYNQQVLDKILKTKDYIVDKHNLLKNDGDLLYNQIPHRDYPPHSK